MHPWWSISISDDLSHVRWIGGASGAGKTAVAAALGQRTAGRVYSCDLTISTHGAEPGDDAPLLSRFVAMSMDQRWLQRDAEEMYRTFPWFAGERFGAIVEDLRALPADRVVIAEGFRLLPDLLAPLLTDRGDAIWLVPTPAFRRQVFARRHPDQQFWTRTSDPATALERLLARDELFGERVRRDAARLGLTVLTVDGELTEEELVEQVAERLRL